MRERSVRLAGWLTAVLVTVLTLVTIERAAATATVPNATRTHVTVPAGTVTPYYPLASKNTPVHMMIAGLEQTHGLADLTIVQKSWSGGTYLNWIAHGTHQDFTRGGFEYHAFPDYGGPQVAYLVYIQFKGWAGETNILNFYNQNTTSAKLVVTQIW